VFHSSEKSENAVAPVSHRRGRPVERMLEASDDSSVDEPLEPVQVKKHRGRDFQESLEEAVTETSSTGAKKQVEKAKRAAKVSGASGVPSTASLSSKSSVPEKKVSVTSSKVVVLASTGRGGRSGSKPSPVGASEAYEEATSSSESVEGEVCEVSASEEEGLELSVEEEEEAVRVRWPPMPTKVDKGVSFYSWVEIDGMRVNRGDSVYLRSGEASKPYVGKLVELKRDDAKGGLATCTIDWWYRSGDVEGEEMDDKELMESSHRASNPILSIATSKRPNIIFGNDAKTKRLAKQQADTYFYYRFFDTANSKVQTL